VALLRITPFLMILAVGLAPVAMEVCQATCDVHAISAMAAAVSHGHDGHSQTHAHAAATSAPDHRHPAASHDKVELSFLVAGQVLEGVPHSCSHADNLPASAGATAQQALSAPAVVAATLDLRMPATGLRSWTEHVRTPVPLRMAATTQLRV